MAEVISSNNGGSSMGMGMSISISISTSSRLSVRRLVGWRAGRAGVEGVGQVSCCWKRNELPRIQG